MNVDSVAKLIEGSTVQEFRTLSVLFLDLVGLRSATYSDGPYDGGKDLYLVNNPSGIDVAIQLSIETKWRAKLEKDVIKAKSNYQSTVMYFLSSRRIPERTFSEVSKSVLANVGVSVFRYDCQAIASEIIKNNKVSELLSIFGITATHSKQRSQKHFGAKNEAISALLIFGSDAREFRKGVYESIFLSLLGRHPEGLARNSLVQRIVSELGFSSAHHGSLDAHIDRLLQCGRISSKEGNLFLSDTESTKYEGLRASSEYDYQVLEEAVNKYLENSSISLDRHDQILIIENLLELAVALVGEDFDSLDSPRKDKEVYFVIKDSLDKKIGKDKSSTVFNGLSEVVANTAFTKKIAAAEVYRCLLNTNSSQLIGALGGSEGAMIYFDSSVFIPLLCGLLFEPASDRAGKSSSLLFGLLKEHEFSAVVPDVYVEEMASHLIDACRDYRDILDLHEDLSYSGNAFVSHFSEYSHSPEGASIDFDQYVRVFGVHVKAIHHDMPDQQYFSIRDRAKQEIIKIAARYGFSIADVPKWNIGREMQAVRGALEELQLRRPPILIKHDAGVIRYLFNASSEMMSAQVLCTWDNAHKKLAPSEQSGYHVLNPVSVIDLFSIAKQGQVDIPLAHLMDFASTQSKSKIELGSKIWDEIVRIEKSNISDAQLLLSAKDFKNDYMKGIDDHSEFDIDAVSKAWLAWKNTKALTRP